MRSLNSSRKCWKRLSTSSEQKGAGPDINLSGPDFLQIDPLN